jgi:hypothetical protein
MQIRWIIALSAAAALVGAGANGCSSSKSNSAAPGESGDGGDEEGGGGGDGGTPCTGFDCTSGGDGAALAVPCMTCVIPTCGGSTTTTITGVVYDPAGSNPVYNVQVYVPSAALPAFTPGVACESCNVLYPTSVLASAVTDTSGKFTISKAPAGANIPIVIQIGKWRRQYTIPNVAQCVANNAGTLLNTSLRLPGSSSEGDLPDIAISTGAADSLECLPLRMGVDKSEYVPGASSAGHIHIFTGGASGGASQGAVTSPASPQAYTNLWDSEHDLNVNDAVLFSCEGAPTAYLSASDGSSTLLAYLNNGGRVFASHYHFSWFDCGADSTCSETPPNPFLMQTPPLATWSNTTNDAVLNDNVSYPTSIVTTQPGGAAFAEGAALKTWLGVVDALDSNGDLDVWYARDNSLVTATNTSSQAWATLDPVPSGVSASTQYFSFDTPFGTAAVEQCGRAVYSDLHVSGGPGVEAQSGVTPDYQAGGGIDIVPSGCAVRALTPQEKALEFMLFDLTSCLVPVSNMPPPPIMPQ